MQQGLLLAALKRSRLIAENATVESINLSRSGRTDRGVSGLGQASSTKGLLRAFEMNSTVLNSHMLLALQDC